MKPNIIFFNPDQFRTDGLSHLGFKGVNTPNLDRMVGEGATSFRNAFCQNPVCTPSRCSLMTGLYPHVAGHRTMDHMLHAEKGEHSMLRVLKDNGYFVWWGGKNDLIPGQDGPYGDCDVKFTATKEDIERWGGKEENNLHRNDAWRGSSDKDNYYSFYAGALEGPDGKKYFDNDWSMIKGAIEFVENYDGEKPFVIYLPLLYPHPPYGVEPEFEALIKQDEIRKRKPDLHDSEFGSKPRILKGIRERQHIQGWTEDRFEKLRATYYGMCARIDHMVGLLVDAMRKKGLWDESMFFFYSDHGDFTGDYGLVEKNQNSFEDSITNVPLIVKLPESMHQKKGESEALSELIDISATVYDVTGIKPPYWTFGNSLVPCCMGEATENRDAVFCEGGRLHGEQSANEHTFLDRFEDPSTALYWPRVGLQQEEEPFYHGKATMLRTHDYKYVKRTGENDEFYDLRKDPDEEENRINDPLYRDVILSLRYRMLDWYQQTCDTVPLEADQREFDMESRKFG